MAFERFEVENFSTYNGIRVSTRSISVSIKAAKRLKEKGFQRAYVEYDKEEGLIKLSKAEADEGYRVSWGSIPAKLCRVMPEGRYQLINDKELIFKKHI